MWNALPSRLVSAVVFTTAVGCNSSSGVAHGVSGGNGGASMATSTSSAATSTATTATTATSTTAAATTTQSSSSTGTGPCLPIPGVSYGSLGILGPPTVNPPAAKHPDINVKIRGWVTTGGALGFVNYNGPTDAKAPRLNTLYPGGQVPVFVQNYQVENWNWTTMMPSGPDTDSPVTMIDFATTPGEILDVPNSGYIIGASYQVHVLYADADSLTLKYTGEDNVIYGYTLHVLGVCVEPSLLALYEGDDAAGRQQLPALAGMQAFGRARSTAVKVAIRDTGTFMDPRSKKDWWP